MFPYHWQGQWCFDAWAVFHGLPYDDDIDNIVISQWIFRNTKFCQKGVKLYELDWMHIAERYREYIQFKTETNQRKQRLSEVFDLWRRKTVVYQTKLIRQKGKICAKVAAARARGSTEKEIYLTLI